MKTIIKLFQNYQRYFVISMQLIILYISTSKRKCVKSYENFGAGLSSQFYRSKKACNQDTRERNKVRKKREVRVLRTKL